MDLDMLLRFAGALILVLALIAAVAWLGRRLGLAPLDAVRKSGARRLKVVEVLALDARRRLVLVRRDGTEHLILLGQGTDLVVERAILGGAPQETGQ